MARRSKSDNRSADRGRSSKASPATATTSTSSPAIRLVLEMKSLQILSVIVLLCGVYIGYTSSTSSDDNNNNKVCNADDDPNCKEGGPPLSLPSQKGGPLRPSDLPQPLVFTAFESNRTVTLSSNGARQVVAEGKVQQINKSLREESDGMVDFAVLPAVVDRADIRNVLDLLESFENYHQYDDE